MVAVTIFLGAFLLFAVQPMAAKALLPAFGGAASVWTTCLLFFQAALLFGYWWANLARPRVHLILLLLGVLSAGTVTAVSPGNHPVWDILRSLAVGIGLPYLLLAATSPLMQRWSSSATPYRLYAVSNAASLLALLSYPVLIEPWLTLEWQWRIWRGLFDVFALLCAWCVMRRAEAREEETSATRIHPLWLLLPACGTGLLMATTNQMCQEIASIPFLWVVPLSIYLLTFILVFHRAEWYHRRLFSLLTAAAAPAACALYVVGLTVAWEIHIIVNSLALFGALMLCHGELMLLRPPKGGLTRYYLALSAGSALGGALVAVVAPALSTSYIEFPIVLGAAAALGLLSQIRDSGYSSLPPLHRASYIGLMLAAAVPLALLGSEGVDHILATRRNFYGILRVTEADGFRRLTHGATIHGTQFLDPQKKRTPTAYFGWNSAVGQALEGHPHRTGPMRIGIIGLGAGTLARYGRKGDTVRFYEINPQVGELAHSYFSYLSDAEAAVSIIPGDARLSMRNEPAQNYDVLIVDAFSSDAIPAHLLTAECAVIYRRHVASGGWLLIHISNRTLDLDPVVRGIGRKLNWSVRRSDSLPDSSQGTSAATWMVLQSDQPYVAEKRDVQWTDEFAALWPVLK